MSVLSPDDARSLSIVLVAAAEEYAQDTRQTGLRQAIDSLELLLRIECEFQKELYLKHGLWRE